MNEPISIPNGPIDGTLLLHRDLVPITAAEGARTKDLQTVFTETISIDIKASHACTVQLFRLPDGVSAGEESEVATVLANTATCLLYSQVRCQGMRLAVTNTAGVDQTSLSLYVRGGS